jgi:hypothetical protein
MQEWLLLLYSWQQLGGGSITDFAQLSPKPLLQPQIDLSRHVPPAY